jgi:hypothetical protein
MSILDIDSPRMISDVIAALRQKQNDPLPFSQLVALMDQWRGLIEKDRQLMSIPGAPFLTMWLRRNHLEEMVRREIGPQALDEQWQIENKHRTCHLPVGVVAHWPATNVEVQPLLTAFCGLLSKNLSVVRVSPTLKAVLDPLVNSLYQHPQLAPLASRIKFISFASSEAELNNEMAKNSDGAMIWGGTEAIKQIRTLDFPSWARINCFGPRISAAAVHASAYVDENRLDKLATRIARDVWQFEQMACSSPQVVFIEQSNEAAMASFRQAIIDAFEREAAAHPRPHLDPHFTSTIVQARANWIFADAKNKATFSPSPDWTLLESTNNYQMPAIVGHKVLHLSWVDSLNRCVELFDGHVQTLGLLSNDVEQEMRLAELAVTRGVDRVVPVGKMHVFDSPWDGMPLLSGLMRTVKHGFGQTPITAPSRG